MKIMCLYGSPRPDGNSAAITDRFSRTAVALGASVTRVRLHRLSYCGCTACDACKRTADNCAIQDDLLPVLEEIVHMDVLAIATPVYFAGLNARVCAFLERTCAYFKVDWAESEDDCRLKPGKKLVFIQTQARPEHLHRDLFEKFEKWFGSLGFHQRYYIHAGNLDQDTDIQSRPEVLARAEAVAREIYTVAEAPAAE